MKFIAILRDSVREALDYKVIYFLFGLSGLVILLVASVSYRPEPGEPGLQAIVKRLPGGQEGAGLRGAVNYEVDDFKQVNEPRPVWQGEFRYTLTASPGISRFDLDDEGDGNEEKGAGRSGALREVVLWDLLRKKPEQWTEEDRRVLRKIQDLDDEFMEKAKELSKKGGPDGQIPPHALRRLGKELLQKMTSYLTEGQLTRFLQTHLAASGTMDVTEVKLLEEKGRTARFTVEAKARPETIRTWPHTPYLFFGLWRFPM